MNINMIASGSKGNAFQITRGDEVIQIDCGVKTTKPDHLLITHKHKDHSLYFNDMIMAKVKWWAPIDVAQSLLEGFILADQAWELYERPKGIEHFKVDHDVPCSGFVIEHEHERYCHITDGTPTEIKPLMNDCAYYGIESNYDTEMLRESKIGSYLKSRIERTHMSNDQAIALAEQLAGEHTKEVRFIHMSRERNSVEIAKMAHVDSELERKY